jgi:hypothetical protein
MMNNPEPRWQDYADDLYREPTPKSRRIWLLAAIALTLIAVAVWRASPLISADRGGGGILGIEVRQTMSAVQQQMETARLAGDGTFVLPFPGNPHETNGGIFIAICLGEGNATYLMTGYREPGQYWNAADVLPGAVSGPEATASCELAAQVP